MDNDTSNNSHLNYLCVDDFLTDLMDAQTISAALQNGLISHLENCEEATLNELSNNTQSDSMGLKILIGLLEKNNVLINNDDTYCLSANFKKALEFKDLLEAKIDFSNIVLPDVITHFPTFLKSIEEFMRDSSIFDLFGYHRCFDPTEENYALTRKWMGFTSAYTRYEAEACMLLHDFSVYEEHMDIGGNSGEFALRLCKKNKNLKSTVIDLPLVCDIGEEHVSTHSEASRITFLKKDGLTHELPKDRDCVTFKSILHDWPEEASLIFLTQAYKSLKSGGTVIIFERGSMEGINHIPFSMIPIFLFIRSFRTPDMYKKQLDEIGFTNIQLKCIQLDVEFFVLTATKE